MSPTSNGSNRAREPGPTIPASVPSNPLVLPTLELLGRGEYAAAVRLAYRTAVAGTVRAYGLSVLPGCTDRSFLKESLRPDMGRLSDLLRELYRSYEPVRFGKLRAGDDDALRELLQRLCSETVLGRIYDPLYQPNGPMKPGRTIPRSPRSFRRRRNGKGS